MKEICLVTYTRSTEGFTEDLDRISSEFYKRYRDKFKIVICCEKYFDIRGTKYDVEFMEMSGTKYRRLISLMEKDDSKYYLSIDNDIAGNISELLDFAHIMLRDDYEVGWGRIRAKRQKGFISNMVAVDKLLSHNIIRPLLWKFDVGISIPGQVFCIKGESFRGKLIQLDTFLDDLALGLYVNINGSKKYVISAVLGEEQPNSKFVGLWKQRSRWAIGYSTILKAVRDKKEYRNKVIIHGLSYHFSWILNWLVIISLVLLFWPSAIGYMFLISILIARKDVSLLFYALVYQLVFPIFHIKWGSTFFCEMARGD
ncbi:MAG: glycosyltransferase family 2 protein [Lachnospiraceae bacterium]|nr:glycosyltransferase family 2 protein [Lachnospiraceae bacterium]